MKPARAALLVLMTLAAYLPALRGGFIWDDDAYIVENQALRSWDGLRRIWVEPGATPQYYPLTFTSFWLEHQLWEQQPFGYHLVNVLLHAANAVLLWLALRQLQVTGAWWIAAAFALHPVAVESVAWITERKNVLSGLFYLLAALTHLRQRRAVSLALFVCALLSKTATCSLPAVLLLLTWWKTGRVTKRDVAALLPFFAAGLALGLVTVWVEKHVAGATGAEWALSLGQRCLLAGRALWFYAGKLVWPVNLSFIYPRWELDTGAAWQYLFPLGVLAVLAGLWRWASKDALVGVLFFVITLAPALGFFDVYPFRYSYVADHFQYLASIGLIALAAGSIRRAAPQIRLVGVPVLLALGILTWKQTHIYRDLETLWRDTLAKNPQAWLAHYNLGVILHNRGNPLEAIGHYEQALRLKPDLAEPHYNWGNALADLGRLGEAVAQYQEALRLRPGYVDAMNNLGVALAQLGRVPEAIQQWEQVVRIAPHLAEPHNNLGKAFATQGRTAAAVAQFRIALELARQNGNTGLADEIQARLASHDATSQP
jgi:tetratricopeptide (TPR) repeat protein